MRQDNYIIQAVPFDNVGFLLFGQSYDCVGLKSFVRQEIIPTLCRRSHRVEVVKHVQIVQLVQDENIFKPALLDRRIKARVFGTAVAD